MSTSEDDGSVYGFEEPPRKKRKKINKEEELEDTITENVESFLDQRYQETEIHV